MDIIKTILDLLSDSGYAEKFKPVLSLLKDNDFDLKKTLQNITPQSLLPLLKDFITSQKKETPTYNGGISNGLNPISTFADKEIINSLNGYFS